MDARGSILIVDDNLESLRALERALAQLGHAVSTASDGVSALFSLANASFDLVLLDVMLPDMSGFEILDRIREDFSLMELPVIVISAVSHSQDIVTALSRGANDYVTKPYDFSVIHSRIKTQVALKRTGLALRLSEERYSLAAEATKDGLWDWKLGEESIFVSTNWKSIVGLPQGEPAVSLREWASRVNPQEREPFLGAMEALRKGESERLEFECRLRHSDGSFRWVAIRAILLRGRKGSPIRIAGAMSDITDSKLHNSLSKLPNAVLLGERIERALERIRLGQAQGESVLFIDLDGFRFINQAYGPANGDKILLTMVERLKRVLCDGATLAHYGRDEFIAFLEEPKDPKSIVDLVQRLQDSVQTPIPMAGYQAEIMPTACVGIVIMDAGYESAAMVIQDAESAMNMAKGAGANQFRFFRKEYHDSVKDRLEREKELRLALKNQQFVLHYQPQVRIDDGRLMGFEALLRRVSPSGELEMPERLIPFAEENGLIHKLGEWILKTACMQIRAWKDMGMSPPRVAINLSPIQFNDEGLAGSLTDIIRASGIDPSDLELEITESKAMENPKDTLRIMGKLKELGVSFSIDDFGTGYSSLSMLQRFPLSTLKIDKTFVSEVPGNCHAKSIIEAIIAMARSMRFSTIAEGVENSEQLEYLRSVGCDNYQGFYMSKAVDAAAATALLRSFSLEIA